MLSLDSIWLDVTPTTIEMSTPGLSTRSEDQCHNLITYSCAKFFISSLARGIASIKCNDKVNTHT